MCKSSCKISVIVPVYNVEKYLCQCIDSILAQTFTDFELLLVDDGSTDGSGRICDEYAEKDARIRVFHTENKGVSAARNLGMGEARADWLCFVDSDDWVETCFLTSLYGDGFVMDESVVFQRIFIEYENSRGEGRISSPHYINITLRKPFDGGQMERYEVLGDFFVLAKIFSTNLIRKHGIRFCEGISMSEDVAFLRTYLRYVKEIRLQSSMLYHYMQRSVDSLSKRRHTSEEWLLASDALMEANLAMLDNFALVDGLYMKRVCTGHGLYQLYFACINAEEGNYRSIFSYVRGKKGLFDEYFYPLNLEQRMFRLLFFARWMPGSLMFFMIKSYRRIFKS